MKTRIQANPSELDDSSEAFESVKKSVIRRDGFVCQGCGWRTQSRRSQETEGISAEDDFDKDENNTDHTSGYFEVHHKDHDHTNNDKTNLITLCPFCHGVFHVGYATGRNMELNQRFTVIYVNEDWNLGQAALNRFCHVLFCVLEENNGMMPQNARYMYDRLRNLTAKLGDLDRNLQKEGYLEEGEECFVTLTESPQSLGGILYDFYQSNPEMYEQRRSILSGIRLLPKRDAFSDEIRYWANVIDKSFPEPSKWMDMDDKQLLS